MNSFAGIMSVGETVTLTNCLMGLLSFCTIALGGLAIGGYFFYWNFLDENLSCYKWMQICPLFFSLNTLAGIAVGVVTALITKFTKEVLF